MPHATTSPLATSLQLVQVIAEDWSSRAGRLQRYTRPDALAGWQAVGEAIPVTLGRTGLAWGIGLHQETDQVPAKREGDGRAPVGVFAITALFGDRPLSVTPRLPYLAAHADLKAVDDPASRHYNRIVDQRDVERDWQSAEDMQRDDDRYALGAVVAHNSEMPRPGAGSCIFLHVWAGPGQPTAGCTAMALADMVFLAKWLDAAALPVLVQLPKAEYRKRQMEWRLPALAD